MNTNPRWLEIQDRLQASHHASDFPQIVVRVFHAKMKKLIQLLESGTGGLIYLVYVVEFQKRGLLPQWAETATAVPTTSNKPPSHNSLG